MKDELIINGKKYVHTPEVKEERLSGYIRRVSLTEYKGATISPHKVNGHDDTRMIEIREGEIIVSEDDVMKAWVKLIQTKHEATKINAFLRELGFKKGGV